MKTIFVSNKFKKDFKLVSKRGWRLKKLEAILNFLATEKELPARCHLHKLMGQYNGLWECHIEPDWLLIYAVVGAEIELFRTGTHADLFG